MTVVTGRGVTPAIGSSAGGDIDGLLEDVQRRLPAGKTLTEHHADMVRQLWSQFIPRISRRQLLPPPPSPPAKLSIPKLPKVRDRLARLWTSSVVDGLVAVSQQ